MDEHWQDEHWQDDELRSTFARLGFITCSRSMTALLRRAKKAADISDVKGKEVTLQLRQENFLQQASDVYAVIWSAGGGFGDPLERDPSSVREDVIDNRSVSIASGATLAPSRTLHSRFSTSLPSAVLPPC